MNTINENQLKELENALYWIKYNIDKWYKEYQKEQQLKEVLTIFEQYKIEILTISLLWIIAILISIIYIKITKEH